MLAFVLALVLALAGSGCATRDLRITLDPQPENHAWWLRTRYHPTGSKVRGIAARNYDPDWCAVAEVKSRSFPDEAREDPGLSLDTLMTSTATANAAFSVSGAYASGELLQLFVGAYQTCGRASGLFLAVLSPQRGRGARRIVQVMKFPPGPGFVYIVNATDGRSFSTFGCFQCDDQGPAYRWENDLGRFVELPGDDVLE